MLRFAIPGTESEDESSARQVLQRGRDLRGKRWITIALSEHQRPPPQARMLTCMIGEEAHTLEDRIGVELEVVDHPTREVVLGGRLQDAFVRRHHFG